MNRPAGAELAAARRRVRNVLVAGVALGSTGHIAAVTVATIVAREMLGSQALAGRAGRDGRARGRDRVRAAVGAHGPHAVAGVPASPPATASAWSAR